jgi:hypothetical protein
MTPALAAARPGGNLHRVAGNTALPRIEQTFDT